jgi:hypothetical protein
MHQIFNFLMSLYYFKVEKKNPAMVKKKKCNLIFDTEIQCKT